MIDLDQRRFLFPFAPSSLADLYDETSMPPSLRKAHQANDRAILATYGFARDLPEAEIVARLFERLAFRARCSARPSRPRPYSLRSRL